MATKEDFTFPIITNFSFSIDSPPLWHMSPSEKEPTRGIGSHDHLIKNCGSPPRRSFSLVRREDNVTSEDKMDMLWENFNEELIITRSNNCNGYDSSSSRFDSGRASVGCVQGFRLSKNNVGTVFKSRSNNDKPVGLEVFIKVLKKFFLLHSNSHNSVNQQPQFSCSS